MTEINRSDTYAGPITELRAASAADGGTALSTTAAFILLPDGINFLSIEGRNYSTAVVAKVAVNPYLIVFKTTDNLETITDYSKEAQDADTGTDVTLSSLDTAANGDYLYVGSHLPFRGVRVDVDSANSNASVLTVNYWNGTSWTSISATDGSASGGATFAQDGNITWTVPTAWVKATLEEINSPSPSAWSPQIYRNDPFYWTRWQVSAALDSSTTLNSMIAMNRSEVYAELVSGKSFETAIHKGVKGIGCVEALTNAGTANLIVNVGVRPPLVGIGL